MNNRILNSVAIISYKHNLIITLSVLAQITTEYQSIVQSLENLENAITYSKLNVLHNSIIKPSDLLNEIKNISQFIHTGHKLPFEPKLENLLLFEKMTTMKSYSKLNQIIFIIEVPLVENENYSYFKLFSLPIPKDSTFQSILPLSKYLILNGRRFATMDEPCDVVTETTHICKELNPSIIDASSPCELKLMNVEQNLSNCEFIQVTLTKTKFEKLSKV